ncbi:MULTISPECIES: LysE family translocator [unclassified Agarivorans]|uniref:LysE family translocator n=1 Tax=unclassified Agarivorans TaxID=2636026 RepID=UPI003D7D150D
MSVFVSMFLFALIGAITPGPVNIIATGAGVNFGFRRALPHVLGASLSYSGVVLLAGLGLNSLSLVMPLLTPILQYLAAAYLLYMALRIGAAPVSQTAQLSLAMPPKLLEGVLVQGLNPKAWLVAMSGVSLFVSSQQPAFYYLLVFCLVSFIVCLFGVGAWAALGTLISSFLATPRRMRGFNLLMASLLVLSVCSWFW